MPNCYAKPLNIFTKLTIPFIIKAIVKVVRIAGLEPANWVCVSLCIVVLC